VAVEALAAQRDEEVALFQRARIGADPGESDIGPLHFRIQNAGGFGKAHHPAFSASALRTTLASL
jgi:hypothetical protein